MDRSLKNQFSVSHNEDMYQETYDPRTMQLEEREFPWGLKPQTFQFSGMLYFVSLM